MRYVAGTQLTFEVPLVDAAGNSVDATSIEYSVQDGDGTLLIPFTPLADYVQGTDAVVIVPASANALLASKTRDAREIVLRCVSSTGMSIVSTTYIIEASTGALVRGVNSLVMLGAADMLASEMPDVGGWASSIKQQKVNALIEAYRRLGNLRLIRLDGFYYNTSAISNPFRNKNARSLLDLSVTEVLSLDPKMYAALSQAQVAEADVILSGDAVEAKRRDGVVLDTVGEVKQMFRNAKPLLLPISAKALKYVAAYTSFGAKAVGRS